MAPRRKFRCRVTGAVAGLPNPLKTACTLRVWRQLRRFFQRLSRFHIFLLLSKAVTQKRIRRRNLNWALGMMISSILPTIGEEKAAERIAVCCNPWLTTLLGIALPDQRELPHSFHLKYAE